MPVVGRVRRLNERPRDVIPRKIKKGAVTTGKDFTETVINVGDLVAYSQAVSSALAFGKISGFTPKGVRIEEIKIPNGAPSSGNFGYLIPTYSTPVNRLFSQVVKLPQEMQEFAMLPVDRIRDMFDPALEKTKAR